MNLLKATYTSDRITIGNNAFSVALSAEQRVGLANHSGEITFGFRAENVALSTQGSEAFVHDVENHGVEKVVTLKSGDQLFRVTTAANIPLHIEQKVHFEIDLSKIHIFDGATGKRIG
jgi:multiple sugar transport system ATP-binding protein